MALIAVLPFVGLAAAANSTHRELSSPGCQSCCFGHDCRLAYMSTSAGTCCGAHPATRMTQCCPFGASCVACGSHWRCSNSRVVTRSTRCSICATDPPFECGRYGSYGVSYHPGAYPVNYHPGAYPVNYHPGAYPVNYHPGAYPVGYHPGAYPVAPGYGYHGYVRQAASAALSTGVIVPASLVAAAALVVYLRAGITSRITQLPPLL